MFTANTFFFHSFACPSFNFQGLHPLLQRRSSDHYRHICFTHLDKEPQLDKSRELLSLSPLAGLSPTLETEDRTPRGLRCLTSLFLARPPHSQVLCLPTHFYSFRPLLPPNPVFFFSRLCIPLRVQLWHRGGHADSCAL
jgi:hypothetical protein